MKPSRAKWWLWAPLGLIVVFLGGGLLIGSGDDEKRAARQKIDSCWEEQKRKSYSPEAGRLLAGACETYESQFQAKYGVKP